MAVTPEEFLDLLAPAYAGYEAQFTTYGFAPIREAWLARAAKLGEVITARTSRTPTLVFDEVDVGIGGATGDVVGQLLRQLGDQGQVICVTHLAQVASKAHQHLQVSKESDKKSTQSTLVPLNGDSRIEEIARMMGGAKITEQSLAHAREMAEAV